MEMEAIHEGEEKCTLFTANDSNHLNAAVQNYL